MTRCSLHYALFHFPNKGSVITYFPSGVHLRGELLGWVLLAGGTCSPRDQVEAAPLSPAVLETLRPCSSTKRRDSIMRQQLKASSKTASKEKVPLGFIWPGLPDSLHVSLSWLNLSLCTALNRCHTRQPERCLVRFCKQMMHSKIIFFNVSVSLPQTKTHQHNNYRLKIKD